MNEFRVRAGVSGDAERLAALGIQVWLHTYATEGISQDIARYALEEFTAARMSALLARGSTAVLVAEFEENIIGYAVVVIGVICQSNARARVELATLHVQEHFTRQGAGSLLLDRAEVLARQRVASVLWLMVNAANLPAITFYSHHGYTRIGTAYFELGEARYENHVLIGKDA
jgi:ribosomal protein S18 acetylase RimI-like enzyme